MALSDFSQMQAAVAKWAWKEGDAKFLAAIPDFFALVENIVQYGEPGVEPLRVREMENTATVTLTNGVGPLPDDYLEFRQVTDGSNPNRLLEPVDGWYGEEEFPWQGLGRAAYFAVNGTSIRTYPKSASNLTLAYYQKIPALTQADPVNWLLTKAPNVYLFGALMQAAPYMREDERLGLFGQRFAAALNGLRSSDGMAKVARAVARPRGVTP